MPIWRCPHCGTPQSETSRCWVCHRSSTSCGTCRHFRRSIAAGLGYCGLDAGRSPLLGEEIRPCWEGGVGVVIGPGEPDIAVELPLSLESPLHALRPESRTGLWPEGDA